MGQLWIQRNPTDRPTTRPNGSSGLLAIVQAQLLGGEGEGEGEEEREESHSHIAPSCKTRKDIDSSLAAIGRRANFTCQVRELGEWPWWRGLRCSLCKSRWSRPLVSSLALVLALDPYFTLKFLAFPSAKLPSFSHILSIIIVHIHAMYGNSSFI